MYSKQLIIITFIKSLTLASSGILNVGFDYYNDINKMDEAFITSTAVGVLPCFWENWESKYKICLEIKNSIQKNYF